MPIRLAKGWLKPRLYGGRPDGILSAVVAPQDARVTTLVERLVIEVSAHGYERTFAEVPVQEPTGIDQAAKATAQTVVVRSLEASRVRPIELVRSIARPRPDALRWTPAHSSTGVSMGRSTEWPGASWANPEP